MKLKIGCVLVYPKFYTLKFYTLNLMPLMVYPKVLFGVDFHRYVQCLASGLRS